MSVQRSFTSPPDGGDLARIMEEVFLSVRRHWFGARTVPLECATSVLEPGGELIQSVDGTVAQAEGLIAGAQARQAFVVVTDHSRPSDLAARLRVAGFRTAQRQVTYILDEAAHAQALTAGERRPVRRGLMALLRNRSSRPVRVEQVTERELPEWNWVCWKAFESRSSLEHSLREKQTAFRSMGDAARWYLARVGDEPVGTAMIYQAPGAAQLLAVGTLPAHRERGIASTLVRRIVRDWQADGFGFLFLDTAPGSSAERLYQRLGFQEAYRRDIYALHRFSPLA